MSGNHLVINVDIREIRVALIENGILAELHIERLSSVSTLGNVYLGKVSRVLPGMQAAFIDIGQERAAFLHVEDLIRPDDFETYLSGGGAREDDDAGDGAAEGGGTDDGEEAGGGADDPGAGAEPATRDGRGSRRRRRRGRGGGAVSRDDEGRASPRDGDAAVREGTDREEDERAMDADEAGDDDVGQEADSGDEPAPDAAVPESDFDVGADAEADAIDGEEVDESTGEPLPPPRAGDSEPPADLLFEEVTTDDTDGPLGEALGARPEEAFSAEPGQQRGTGIETATADRARSDDRSEVRDGPPRGRRRRRSRHARGGGSAQDARHARPEVNAGTRRATRRRSTHREKSVDKSRIPKNTPIREVVREGQHVVVQVTKEPIGSKGARVSSHVSLPGRYVVYLPTVEHTGISKRIGSAKERDRLRDAIQAVKPPTGGLVVRTVAEGLTKKQLKNDVGYLVRLWGEIAKKRDVAQKAPSLLYEELDLILKAARDLFTEDVSRIVIDNREQYVRLRRFVEMFMPERVDAVELYTGAEPVFDAYGIEDEIGRALSRKVPLASGGYLIIDQAEALTAIDVNTGRYVGKGHKDLEDTILQTNLEAVEEIAYQLRFRNIGGLIILDLIDMERTSNREKVRRRLEELLAKDKAKTTLNRISDLGLIEMTRKRTRESLGRLLHEPCFYCDGTGQLMSKETIAYEILRQIRREQAGLKGYKITVNAHPAVVDLLKSEEREAVQEAERMFARRIELVPCKEYHIEQFDLQGI